MFKEKQPSPIKELQGRKTQLDHLINQRQSLVKRIGTGEIKVGSSPENTLKVGRVRKRVKESITRLGNTMQEVDQELNIYNQAQDYIPTLAKKREELREMSEMIAEGLLTQGEIKAHYEELKAFENLPNQNPALKRAIERLQEQEKAKKEATPTKETKPAPTLKINRETGDVTIVEGEKTTKHKVEDKIALIVLLKLAQKPGKSFGWRFIHNMAIKAGSKLDRPAQDSLAILQKELGQTDHTYQYIAITVRGKNPSYRLNTNVEFVEKKAEPPTQPETPKDIFFNKEKNKPNTETFPETLAAIALIMGDPNITSQDIVNIMRVSQKTNKPLPINQARFSLNRQTSIIEKKINKGTATKEEKALWEKIEQYEAKTGKSIIDRVKEIFAKKPVPTTQSKPLHVPLPIKPNVTANIGIERTEERVVFGSTTIPQNPPETRPTRTMPPDNELAALINHIIGELEANELRGYIDLYTFIRKFGIPLERINRARKEGVLKPAIRRGHKNIIKREEALLLLLDKEYGQEIPLKELMDFVKKYLHT